jgi:hypothetical protein
MSRILLCRRCQHWYSVVQQQIPDICPHCEASASWTTDPDPEKPYRLSWNDRKFLTSIRVADDDT